MSVQNRTPDEPESPRDTVSCPGRVRVPAHLDVFGNPVAYVEADPAAAGQWDQACWSVRPPS
jgi:hypothetical protein